jgi:hypothetical protein
MQPNDQSFNGPIPGASLTHEPGSQPDERPPMYVDPTEAYDFLVDRIANPDVFKRIAVAAELGVPLELMVRPIVFSGWAEGYYTNDVMHLIAGPIFELTGKLLEKSGVDYIPLAPRKQDESYENLLDMLYKRREALEQGLDEPDDEDEQPEMMQEEGVSEPTESLMDQAPVEEEEVSAPSSGLMGRPE